MERGKDGIGRRGRTLFKKKEVQPHFCHKFLDITFNFFYHCVRRRSSFVVAVVVDVLSRKSENFDQVNRSEVIIESWAGAFCAYAGIENKRAEQQEEE